MNQISYLKSKFLFGKKYVIVSLTTSLLLLGLIILIFIALMAIFVPIFSPYKHMIKIRAYIIAAPSATHWFGTDDLARDMFVRVWEGARISLFIGITAAIIDLIIGVLWGSIAGLAGGRVDNIMMRIADVLTAIPYLISSYYLTSSNGARFNSNDYRPIDYRLG